MMRASFLLLTLTFLSSGAVNPVSEKTIMEAFKSAHRFSHKTDYSPSISDVFIAYDKNGVIIAAAALRQVKPWPFIGLIVVSKEGESYIITRADYPNIEVVENESKRKKLLISAKDAEGVVIQSGTEKKNIDTATGATRYFSRLYISFNMMAHRLVDIMEDPPDWPQKLMPVK